MTLTGWFWSDALAISSFLVIGVFLVYKWVFAYWKRRGVPHVEPQLFFGNFNEILLGRKNLGKGFQELYQRLEPHPFGGIFVSLTPALVIRDPDLIKTMLVKDFQHFQHRGVKVDEENDPLSTHLFNLGGPRWRALRTKLTPTFTSGKMKLMFPLMEACAREMQAALQPLADRGAAVEMKEWNARFTTDVIGTCAFGIQCNSLADPESEFRRMGRDVFSATWRGVFNLLLVRAGRILRVKLVSPKVERFFMDIVRQTVEYRKRNNVTRGDFVNLLIQLQEKGHVDADQSPVPAKTSQSPDSDFNLTDGLFAAQCFVFFVAGFETSSTTMSFCLYELTVNPDIQDRVRAEVDKVLRKHAGKMTYDAIQEMSYLDMVMSETLRKYSPAGNLVRTCTVPYTIPGTDVKVEEGVKIFVPIYSLHNDPKYFPDPDKFDPERFTEEQVASRHHFVYMPFGEGPRICIGMRFGLLQAKVGIASLISKFVFSPTERTPAKLRFDPKSVVTSALGGINVRIAARAF